MQLPAIRPRVAERISFDEVAEAHRRLEAVSVSRASWSCARTYRRDATECRLRDEATSLATRAL